MPHLILITTTVVSAARRDARRRWLATLPDAIDLSDRPPIP
jgi:hypothetical protein